MTADEVIELRKRWSRYSLPAGVESLPAATVLAERDWLNYVRAMTAMVPANAELVWPTEAEVNWAWPDGLVIVFAEPPELNHTIISASRIDSGEEVVVPTVPHGEKQTAAGLVIMPMELLSTQSPDGVRGDEVSAAAVVWIAEPGDLVSSWWVPGVMMHAPLEEGISESSRFVVSVVAALGHRLTKLAAPPTQGRGERRRVEREIPGLRVLQLSSGASVRSGGEPGSVEWSHRWMVRGRWRQQACGPRLSQRRLKWIDPYVKGPEDKPLDVRQTIWSTGHKVPDET